MRNRNQRGVALPVALLLIAILMGIGFTTYYVLSQRHKQTTTNSNEQAVISRGNENSDKSIAPQPTQKYLEIKEWGVRIPVSKSDNDDDMVYFYKKNDFGDLASFTFQRLVDYGICKTDIGVSMSRNKTKNNPPYSIDNPEQLAHLGEYYYSASYGGSYCYDADNKAETAFYTGTNIAPHTVTDALKKLELTPAL